MPFPNESDALLSTEEWIRITRYVTGERETHERARIEQWLSADPNRTELAEDLQEIWTLLGAADAASPMIDESRSSALWNRIAGGMARLNGQDDGGYSSENDPAGDGQLR